MIRKIRDAVRAFLEIRLIPQQLREITVRLNKRDDTSLLLANAERDRLLHDLRRQGNDRLEPFGFKGFSQNDEDGILQEIFRRIGVTNRRFVEFGTGDGSQNNTVFLLCNGWTGLWIDGCDSDHRTQKNTFSRYIQDHRLTAVHGFLTAANINDVIASAGYEGDIDLLSIDIDGNDYHLWKSLTIVRPRAVVIEYNAYAAPPLEWIMPYDAAYVWDGYSQRFSASLKSLEKLGLEKGYQLVGCNLSGLNAFFVRSDLVQDKFVREATAETLFQPRRWWLDPIYATHTVPLEPESMK